MTRVLFCEEHEVALETPKDFQTHALCSGLVPFRRVWRSPLRELQRKAEIRYFIRATARTLGGEMRSEDLE